MPIIIENCGSQKVGVARKIELPYIIIYIGINPYKCRKSKKS